TRPPTVRAARLLLPRRVLAPPVLLPPSLHDALPIFPHRHRGEFGQGGVADFHIGRLRPEATATAVGANGASAIAGQGHAVLDLRSEEHTSELQSRENLVCRLLLEKKKQLGCEQHAWP